MARHSWVLGHKGILALLVLAAATLMPAGSASGSCAGPQLQVGTGEEGPSTVRIGETVAVKGSYFVHGCDDTGGDSGFGCSASNREIESPMKDVALTLKQGQREWRLGQEDAGSADGNRLGQIIWKVAIPKDVRTGPAMLVTDGAEETIIVGPQLRAP